ncbi:hypothetical protein GGH12_005984 [Coemansia sp. RSA 1822]|nr:hypothetical protein LPJ76_000685 [Coemansia sp. RSA 638]KAJ2545324.1 hypothetical protein GGF49_000558 [Coemansia sp. RSA 1853]KAJ2558129.1 hypothetical protein GGH12_005984 [Coemansia sp. RSA 1822]
MEVSLEEFGTLDFDVKAWLNRQFAAQTNGDSAATDDARAQRLVTQLHFLATNAQQNSDRIKARFRHQAAQIGRDIAGLGKAVCATQAQLSGLAQAVDRQAASAPTMAAVVELGTAQRQLARTVEALGLQRSYTDLPQKVDGLVETRDFGRAWALVDGVAGAAGLDADEVQACLERIEAGAVGELGRAVAERDAEAAAHMGQLLAAHGQSELVETEFVRVRAQVGIKALEERYDDIGGLLHASAALITEERTFAEAAEMSDAVQEQLIERFADAMQTEIQRHVDSAEQIGAVSVRGVYDALVGFCADVGLDTDASSALSVGEAQVQHVPLALHHLLKPLRACVKRLGVTEADRIRDGSLSALRSVEFETGRAEAYVRDASRELDCVFSDVSEALDNVLAVVPAALARRAAEDVLMVASEASGILDAGIAILANISGFAVSDLATATELDAPIADLTGAAFQPLANEGKLDAVSRSVALALLAEQLENCTATVVANVRHRLADIHTQPRSLIAAALNGQNEVSETADLDIDAPEINTVAAAQAVVFLLGGAFRVPLERIPESSVWHGAAARSSMGVAVPQFSCAPSEDAVDIGEKMHILLPELEQAVAMHAQCANDAMPLYTFVLRHMDACDGDEEDSPLLAMLALVLRSVQRAFVRQVCCVAPPLSALGCRQLAADAEYIASVAASFGAMPDPDFAELLTSVLRHSAEASGISESPDQAETSLAESQDQAELTELQHTLHALLTHSEN